MESSTWKSGSDLGLFLKNVRRFSERAAKNFFPLVFPSGVLNQLGLLLTLIRIVWIIYVVVNNQLPTRSGINN